MRREGAKSFVDDLGWSWVSYSVDEKKVCACACIPADSADILRGCSGPDLRRAPPRGTELMSDMSEHGVGEHDDPNELIDTLSPLIDPLPPPPPRPANPYSLGSCTIAAAETYATAQTQLKDGDLRFKDGDLTLTVLITTIDAQWEGMGDVGSARYEPALLPPCLTITVLSYSS